MDTGLKIHMSPPLGLLTIANMFREEHKVVVANENIKELDFEDHLDIVGITVTVDVYPRAAQIAEEYRKRGSIVVAGGIHITTAHHIIPEGIFDVFASDLQRIHGLRLWKIMKTSS